MKSLVRIFCIGTAGILLSRPAAAQEPAAASAVEVAKKLANPIASMVSVPLQANLDVGNGPNYGSRLVFNVQPVIPFSPTPRINLITRWIVPIVSQIDMTGAHASQAGLGDAIITAFVGPSQGGITWGIGPAFIVPIATDDALGGKKFAIGPSAVALKQAKGWTVGGLVNHLVSVAGDEARSDIKATFINPFVTYNWKSGAGLALNTEYTHDWTNDIDVLVVMPLLSAVTKFGGQTASLGIGPRLHFAPTGHARYGVRVVFVLVFPK